MSTGCRAAGSFDPAVALEVFRENHCCRDVAREVDELEKSKRVKRKGSSLGNHVQNPLQRLVIDLSRATELGVLTT